MKKALKRFYARCKKVGGRYGVMGLHYKDEIRLANTYKQKKRNKYETKNDKRTN